MNDVHEVIGGIGHWITQRVFYSAGHIAIVDGDRRISYAELDHRTDQLANALRARGVRQGDRVACLQHNGAPFLELLFAAAKLGAIFVPINFRLAAPEVSYLLSDCGADVFVFHMGALGVHTLPLLYVGGTVAILPSFDPAETLATMARERATVQFLVPSMWSALMTVPDFASYDLSALELAITGGAPCPLPVLEFFQSGGVPFQEGFGMTETAPGATLLDADRVREKAGSIGRPPYYVQTKIVDENDREVATGEVGELVLRGPNIFVGYWRLPDATAEAFRGG